MSCSRELLARIVHISDTHISRWGQFLEEPFNKAVAEINRLDPRPDLVIHTGDLTDNGVIYDYEYALKKIEAIEPRLIIAPGNHDERNYGHSLFYEMVSPLDYDIDLGRLAISVANSPEPDRDTGRLGRRRQNHLEERFRTAPKEHVKILVFHHHLIPVPYSGREINVLEDAGDVLEMVLQQGVDLVLMGHRHVRRVLRVENTILVNAGTLSSLRTRGRLGHSYNIIDIFEDGTIRVLEARVGGKQTLLSEYKKEK
jgi:putative phosphoesterase